MQNRNSLHLYEEIMLLALRDKKGTVATDYSEYAVAGAIIAELLLDGRISVDDSWRKRVNLNDPSPTGDPVIDEVIEKIAGAKRRASLKTWISRIAGIKKLRHKVARHLCNRGILRNGEDKVLLLFTRKIYPEINPEPERQIIERMRKAIFTDTGEVEGRTAVLISLAKGADLLKQPFSRKELKPRKKRIEQIVNGDMTGKATKEVIEACQAAVFIAAVMPAIAAGGH
ncbi:MAG: GPP34 family phosphoprotein [Calditrichia bacterium]